MKNSTRSLFQSAILAALASLSVSCTTLFRDNFAADVAGAAPNPHPPGPPIGDEIQWTAGADVVVAQTLATGTQLLNFRNTVYSGSGSFVTPMVQFIPVSASSRATNLYAVWRGQVRRGYDSISFTWGSSENSRIGVLHLEGDGRIIVEGAGIGDDQVIGHFTSATPHTILFELDRAARTFSASFTQGNTTVSRANIAVLDSGADITLRPRLFARYQSAGNRNQAADYHFNDVMISSKAPPTGRVRAPR